MALPISRRVPREKRLFLADFRDSVAFLTREGKGWRVML